MRDDEKTREQLVHELSELHLQNAALKKSMSEIISLKIVAEEALCYAESILETVTEPLLVLNADLKILSASHNFYRTFQVTPGETIGRFIYDLGNGQWDIPILRKLLDEVLPGKRALVDFEVDHTFEYIGDKTMLLNAWQIDQKFIDSKIILLTIEDITERKEMEDLLEASEERLRRLFETVSDGIVFLEKSEGKITHTNPVTEKMLGYNKKESVGHTLQDIGILLDRGDFQRTVRNLNKIGIVNYYDVPIVTKSGRHIHTDIYLVGRARLVQCNIRDITDRKRSEEKLQQTLETLRKALNTTIQVLVSAVEARDPYTAGHQQRVADLSCAIAPEMGFTRDRIDGLHTAGAIHDIGKLSVPWEILAKPTRLKAIEFDFIKVHPRGGYEMLKDVESFWPLAQIAYQHHERMDGSGYPQGLKGEEILMEARIMAVADVVESMASHRSYRPAFGIEVALEEIEKNKGVLYDAAVADACLKLFREKGYKLQAG